MGQGQRCGQGTRISNRTEKQWPERTGMKNRIMGSHRSEKVWGHSLESYW